MGHRRILVIGAHPDDCDIKAGGSAARWRAKGHDVWFVSVANGCLGHQTQAGPGLAERRRKEAERAGAVIGAEYLVMNVPDGEVLPTLELRYEIIRLIRRVHPDLVLSHRLNDYHPDHRATAQLVQDAAYMLTVPGYVPDTPFLHKSPVFGYLADSFQQPTAFRPDFVLPSDDVMPTIVKMLACHESQFFEWLPFNQGILDQVPEDAAARLRFLETYYAERFATRAEPFREQLVALLGPEKGQSVRFADAFEISEYGSPMNEELAADLFAL